MHRQRPPKHHERPLPITAAAFAHAMKVLELAPQQARIVELLLRGLGDKQIAERLQLGLPTVRTYLSRIFEKLRVADRVELILHVVAVSNQLIDTTPHRA